MGRRVVREAVTLAGQAERARVARVFVSGVLGPGHPCGEDAGLLVSELFGNSVRHGRLELSVEGDSVLLDAGDAFTFSAQDSRSFRNASPVASAHVLWVFARLAVDGLTHQRLG